MAKRRGCIGCALLESRPGEWLNGLCPRCAPSATPAGTLKLIPNPEYVKRPLAHLAAVARKYPAIWKQVDMLRSARGKDLPDWPEWCFLPLSGAYAISSGGSDQVKMRTADTAVIGALAPWRVSQGIYRFDPTLFDELWDTPVTGDIPVEILERLPEWCCYIPIDPPRQVLSMDVRGFFVHLEADANDGHSELRFLMDFDSGDGDDHYNLSPIMLDLVGSLSECMASSMAEARRRAYTHGTSTNASQEQVDAAARYLEDHAHEIAPLVSITLYLCSTAAEIVGRDANNKPSGRPAMKCTRRGGPRLFPAIRPETWMVGFRIGATLRAAALRAGGSRGDGTHVGPRPHIRRAHWHAFWTGAKAKPGQRAGDRKLVLRWLHPILVAAGEGDVIPTVHPVR